jgi:hypothetical protein
MQLDIAFAKPIGPYRNPINYIPPTYCHVELSFHTTAETFRRQLTQYMEGSYNPANVQKLLNRIRKVKGTIIVCFYINWGETVSCRYLSEIIDDPYLRPPEEPVYDTLKVMMGLEQSDKIVRFYLKHLGKRYDYSRAILSMFPFTFRSHDPDKFFCSQLVLHSLKEIGIHYEGNPNHVLPIDVYRFLKNLPINKEDSDTNGPKRTDTSSE